MPSPILFKATNLPITGFTTIEPSLAVYNELVLYTQNNTFWLSTDGGISFPFGWQAPSSLFQYLGTTGNYSDMSAIYAPQIDRFFLVMLHGSLPDGGYILRLATTSSDLLSSKMGTYWMTCDLEPKMFGLDGFSFDYPQMTVGERYLYITVAYSKGDSVEGSVWIRVPLSQFVSITEHPVLGIIHIEAPFAFAMFSPVAHNGGSRAVWISHLSTSEIRVFFCDESSTGIQHQDIEIPGWNSADYKSLTPDRYNWLDFRDHRITAATNFGSGQYYFAWTAGREDDRYPHPYIYILNLEQNISGDNSFSFKGHRRIWNPVVAFTHPALLSGYDRLAMAFGWGGAPRYYANFGVGYVETPFSPSSKLESVAPAMSTIGAARWGDFVTVRPIIETRQHNPLEKFAAAGYTVHPSDDTVSKRESHPQYVVFG